MALKIESTENIQNQYVRILVYGQAGSGKTSLCKTLDKPLVLSCENGLLSLAGEKISYVNVRTENDIDEIFTRLSNAKEKVFNTIVLDSITELADLILQPYKRISNDARQAYMKMQDVINVVIRKFSELPYHIYMTCKIERAQDEEGVMLYTPSMPGQKLGASLPYFFDEVLALRVKETDGEKGAKIKIRYLQTDSDGKWIAKDRSGRLAMYEKPDLQAIINKCINLKQDHIVEKDNTTQNTQEKQQETQE